MDAIIDKIQLDFHSSKPIYKQIDEQLRHIIISEQLKVGEHLPSVRRLASILKVNPNTVARAYLELERKRIVSSRRGGGTIVASGIDDPAIRAFRHKHLSDVVNEDIVNVLSQGYSPEELEAAFYLHLERWREEKRISSEVPEAGPTHAGAKKVIRFVGSHDIALNILLVLLKHRGKDTEIEVTHAGSLGGLIALQEERADLAGTHLLDEETSEYNFPFVKRILPGREIVVVNLAYRIQGLMFAAGNPLRINGLTDLTRDDVTFINRQKGSGTRVLLDLQLKQQGILPSGIKGYDVELDTHLAVGSAIVQGKANTGLGIEAAAQSCGLDFLPLFRERYDLVIPGPTYRNGMLDTMVDIIKSDEFKKIVDEVGGYDTSQSGTITYV